MRRAAGLSVQSPRASRGFHGAAAPARQCGDPRTESESHQALILTAKTNVTLDSIPAECMEASQRLAQIFDVNRLGEMKIEAGRLRERLVRRRAEAGERDELRARVERKLAQHA